MTQVQQTIELFNTLYIVCLVLFIIFLIVSIILFFKFDIRNIFNVLTGRSVKKTIKAMNEQNEKTGQLRRVTMQPAPSRKLGRQTGQLAKSATLTGMHTTTTAVSPQSIDDGSNATSVLKPTDDGASATTVLQSTDDGSNATTVLSQTDTRMEDTSVLSQSADSTTSPLKPESNEYSVEIAQGEVDEQYGLFKILHTELHIHTNEVV